MTFKPSIYKIAVITSNSDHASLDRMTLSNMKFREVMVFNTGAKAMEALPETLFEVIILDSEVEDMNPLDIVKEVKKIEHHRQTPTLMVSSVNEKDFVLEAISAGCAGYVIRPYSIGTFEKHIETAHESTKFDEKEKALLEKPKQLLSRGLYSEAINEYTGLVKQKNESGKHFDEGMDLMRKGCYGEAVISFNKTLKVNEFHAASRKGLAEAYKLQGDMEKYDHFMKEAAYVYALQDNLQEAKLLFVEILKNDPNAENPYNTLGVKLRQKGDFTGSLHAYKQALELTPNDHRLYFNIAKAYVSSDRDQRAIKYLEIAIKMDNDFQEAIVLLEKLAGKKAVKNILS